VAVRAQHQLALRAAPHAPDLLHRQNCQSCVPASLWILTWILPRSLPVPLARRYATRRLAGLLTR
jgi:hypothetical protein